MQRLRHQLIQTLKSKGVQQSVLVVGGNFFSMSISAIAIIVISRLLGPRQFGEFSVGLAISLILNRVCDLGLSYALQKFVGQAQNPEEIKAFVSYTTYIKSIGLLITLLLGLMTYRWLGQVLHFNSTVILTAILLSTGVTLFEHLQAVLQSLHRFPHLVAINILQSVLKAAGALVFLVIGQSSGQSLLVWYLVAPLVPVLIFPVWLPQWLQLNFRQNFSREKTVIKSLASHAAIAFIAAGIIENIDVLFVQHYLSSYEAGLLGGTSRIALLFSLTAYSLGNVLYARVSRYHTQADVAAYFKKAVLLAVASAVGFVAIIPLAPLLVTITIGPDYLPGLPIMLLLLGAAFVTIAVVPFIALFFTLDAPWYFSVSGVSQLALIIVGNMLFVPTHGLPATAWTRLITRLFLLAFTVSLSFWLYRRKYHGQNLVT